MTDLEITRLCAEALELPTITELHGEVYFQYDDGSWAQLPHKYDPLHDDVQAMALVKTLKLQINPPTVNGAQTWWVHDNGYPLTYNANDGPPPITAGATHTDLNRAICECVAKMQQAKEKP